MTSKEQMRLCGGTFFCLFTRAMKEAGRESRSIEGNKESKKNITQRNALGGLLTVFYPSASGYTYETEKSNASKFKRCENLSILKEKDLKDNFDYQVKNNYEVPLKAMTNLVERMIDVEGKGERFVKSLLELIEKDKNVLDDQQFYMGKGGKALSKKEILSTSDFCLEYFLLGVWHYCIMEVPDNTVGKETYYLFFPSAKRGGSGEHYEFGSSIGLNPSRAVTLLSAKDYTDADSRNNKEAEKSRVIDGYYSRYFQSITSYISAVKTILFEETINFRDFYVCNGISRMAIRQNGMSDDGDNSWSDDNPTIERVKKFGLRLIIQGVSGTGKSMLMRHLMLDGIDKYSSTGRIPIYVRLQNYSNSNYEVIDFIHDSIKAYFPDVDSERVIRDIVNANYVLLLDGMDEINAAYRGQFVTKLNSFLAVHNQLQVIISTRQFTKDAYVSDFKIFLLNPLSKEKALELIEKLPYKANGRSKKEQFKNALEMRLYNEPNGFAKNPLLLTFMFMTYDRFKTDGSSMPEFYERVYQLLATNHDYTKEGYNRAYASGLNQDLLHRIFAGFCAKTYFAGETNFSETRIIEWLKKTIERIPEAKNIRIDPANVFEDLTSGVCMMIREGDTYSFLHQSFQEYFCAVSISKQKDIKIVKIGNKLEERNHHKEDVTLQMLYGIMPQKTEEFILLPFLKTLLGEDNETGYWNFVKRAYPYFYYEWGKTDSFSVNTSDSYIYSFIQEKYEIQIDLCGYEMPYYKELVTVNYVEVDIDGSYQIVEKGTSLYDEYVARLGYEYEPDIVGCTIYVQTEDILKQPERFAKLIETMNREDFPMKAEYEAARQLMIEMEKRTEMNSEDDIIDI